LKSGCWQGKDIRGMIRTVAVNCRSILDCFQDAGTTAAETALDELVMGAVQALCEFSLLVSQQNDSFLSLTGPDNAMKRCYKKKAVFRDQKISKSAKAKVDQLVAKDSHHLQEQKIHKICTAMEVQLYGAEKVTASRGRQFQVRLNRARQAATI
jgi:hypothetical protein